MWNYRIATIWGIPIRVNVSLLVFIPLLAYLIGSGTQIEIYAGLIDGIAVQPVDVPTLQQGQTPWIVGFAAAIGLFVSVLLHELGHAWVAMRYDIEIESITLWILGGLAALSEIPKEWNREFWIAVAGPFVSLLVGAGGYAVVALVPIANPVVLFVLGWLAIVNVTLVAFNLVPAFPMDGGRILRALLARSQPHAKATRTAARVGIWFAVLFAIVGVFANVMLILVALFIYMAAKGESRVSMLADLLEGFTASDLVVPDLPRVDAETTIEAFGDRMLTDRKTAYLVTEGGLVVGAVTLADVPGVRRTDREPMAIGDVASRNLPRIEATTPAFDAVALLGQRGTSFVLVERDGEVVGAISNDSLAQILALRERGLELKRDVQPF
ncbi:MAG: site-2 protease family protein [Halanaeroarchaeum sp.]